MKDNMPSMKILLHHGFCHSLEYHHHSSRHAGGGGVHKVQDFQ